MHANPIILPLPTVDELDKVADHLHKIIIGSYEQACPLRKHKSGQSVPYYSTLGNENEKKK